MFLLFSKLLLLESWTKVVLTVEAKQKNYSIRANGNDEISIKDCERKISLRFTTHLTHSMINTAVI